MKEEIFQALLSSARHAKENAYAPYSGFRVGAALLSSSGKIYAGCNVENASFPVGLCAERCAVGVAVSSGERSFSAILIVSDADEPCPPCGMCRQVLSEFGSEIEVILLSKNGVRRDYKLKELLPDAFGHRFFSH